MDNACACKAGYFGTADVKPCDKCDHSCGTCTGTATACDSTILLLLLILVFFLLLYLIK